MRLMIRYGFKEATREYFNAPPTVGDLRQDGDLRRELGYGDNVRILVNDVEVPDNTTIPNGATVVIETAANKKAC